MSPERNGVVWYLPIAFVIEVGAWEVGSRLGLAFADPTWEEFGRLIGVQRWTWVLAGAVAVLFAVFGLLSRRRSILKVSMVQLAGLRALVAYWIGASMLASAVVVGISTVAIWVLDTRPDHSDSSH
jgi:hypothetical protein